ncbi:hypothetical protein LEP1GSC036_2243 [Leptospira weilii str. 2006001853]|uniref:Uncharacterized protein n=1 Tax=Leptospira weilii str. 2006001853 TaxID=1001589 RepID=A0A828Z3B2_9LEPT|nr:hypothetical protein LEP1GSC036_2243 [Leptospira weilii str. 2006001853]
MNTVGNWKQDADLRNHHISRKTKKLPSNQKERRREGKESLEKSEPIQRTKRQTNFASLVLDRGQKPAEILHFVFLMQPLKTKNWGKK